MNFVAPRSDEAAAIGGEGDAIGRPVYAVNLALPEVGYLGKPGGIFRRNHGRVWREGGCGCSGGQGCGRDGQG